MKYQIFVSGAADEQVFDSAGDAAKTASLVWKLTKEQHDRLLSGETIWVGGTHDPEGVLLWIEAVED